MSLDTDGKLTFGAHLPLPGSVQTVPRGELFTVVELIKQARDGADIMYVTDNKWVFDSFCKGPKYACKCNNSDLWYELFGDTIKKAIRLNIRWMPSHLDEGKKEWPPMSRSLMLKATN